MLQNCGILFPRNVNCTPGKPLQLLISKFLLTDIKSNELCLSGPGIQFQAAGSCSHGHGTKQEQNLPFCNAGEFSSLCEDFRQNCQLLLFSVSHHCDDEAVKINGCLTLCQNSLTPTRHTTGWGAPNTKYYITYQLTVNIS